MNMLLIACGLILLPGPRFYYKKKIRDTIRTSHPIEQALHSKPDEVNFQSIILGLSIACALVYASLHSGQRIDLSYDLALSVQPENLSIYIDRLLRPPQLADKLRIKNARKNMSKIYPENLIFSRVNVQQQQLLESLQSQLHIYYELALIRGANVQNTLLAMSDRMHTELINLSTSEAEKSAVKLAGPLTLCFLPAFIVLSLIPTIISFTSSLLVGAF